MMITRLLNIPKQHSAATVGIQAFSFLPQRNHSILKAYYILRSLLEDIDENLQHPISRGSLARVFL